MPRFCPPILEEAKMTFGNMTIVEIEDGTCNIKCHCGHEFSAAVKLIDKQKPIRGSDGYVPDLDGDPIRCPECDCKWKKKNRELPPVPSEWKFFMMSVFVEGKEMPAVVGVDTNLRRFAMHTIAEFSHVVEDYKITEIDEDKYNELLDEQANERQESFSRFINGIFGLIFGKD